MTEPEQTKDGRLNGLSSVGSSQQAVSPVPASIPDALLAAIGAANSHGETLRCGDYVSIWDEGEHPYGKPSACPFCKQPQGYTELWYNGPGSPPSYAVMCGHCGAQGPLSSGKGRGDHYGARIDAVSRWNAAQGIEARQGQDGNRPDRNDESPIPEGDAPITPIEGTSHAD